MLFWKMKIENAEKNVMSMKIFISTLNVGTDGFSSSAPSLVSANWHLIQVFSTYSILVLDKH